MNTILTPLGAAVAAASTLALVSCENPADATTDATTTEAVEREVDPDAEGIRYVFTEASAIEFTGSKVTGSHDGGFRNFDGYFTVADGQPVGNDHEVVIDMTSTWSDNDDLTDHLKNEDFFDVEQYPEARFEVTEVTEGEDGDWTIAGNLTLHGQTKNISFPAEIGQNGETVSIEAEFDISRSDFGINYEGKKDDLIRDEVVIRLDLEAEPESDIPAGSQA